MSRRRRRAGWTFISHAAWALAMVLLLVLATGCQSGPARAIRGARHYSAGTNALNQGDGSRAIEELEQAAVLVPHASEIQNHLGLAYWSDGRLRAARGAFERALELDCENEAARENLDRLMEASQASAQLRAEGSRDGG